MAAEGGPLVETRGCAHGRAGVMTRPARRQSTDPDSTDLVALDEALAKLTRLDATKAELVKLRYFAGLTVEQAGQLLGISRATADRYWTFARTWLYQEINKGEESA